MPSLTPVSEQPFARFGPRSTSSPRDPQPPSPGASVRPACALCLPASYAPGRPLGFLDFGVGLEVACVPLSALPSLASHGRPPVTRACLVAVSFAVGAPTCVVSAGLAGVPGGLPSRGTSQ